MAKKTLKQHIKSQGRTISWIAEKIDMSQPLLSMQLKGSATLQQDTITKVCKVINVEPENVLEYEN